MKIYLTDYDLTKRADKTIYASQYSSFKAGIKVPGASDVKLYDGQTEISADASLFHGYKAFPLDAGDAGQKEYTVKADGSELKLKVVATDSTAVELNDKDTVFDLPVATATTLGGVKVGEGLAVAADGTLSASGGQLPSDISANSLSAGSALYAPGISATTQRIVLGDPDSSYYIDLDEKNDTYEIGCEDLTANSIDVGDSINLGGKIVMGDSTSGGYITLGQGSKIQAVGPHGRLTTLDKDGLVITDGSGTTVEVTMPDGVYTRNTNIVAANSDMQQTRVTPTGVTVVDPNSGLQLEYTAEYIQASDQSGNHSTITVSEMTIEDNQANHADVYPTYIAVQSSSGGSRMTDSAIYVESSSQQASLNYDGVYIDNERYAPTLITVDGTQYYVLARQV